MGLEEPEAGPRGLLLAWEDAVSWETGVEDASRFGQGHWPTWEGGDRKQSRIQRTLQVCAACELPKQKWRPQRVYAHLESGGDKNLGCPLWSDGICGKGHYGESVPREGGRTPGPCWR